MSFKVSSVSSFDLIDVPFRMDNEIETNNLYYKVFDTITIQMPRHPLVETFRRTKIRCPYDLKELYSESEIATIRNILDLYFILYIGATNIVIDLDRLGVPTVQDILSPKNDIYAKFQKLVEIPENCSKHMANMLKTLKSYFKIAITPEKIIKLIDRLETFDHSQLLAFLYDPIEKLKEDERCRLAFYLSFCVAFIHLTPEQDPQDLSPEMTKVVRDINRRLRKIKSETPNNFVQITPPLQFLFKKPDIAALPNFIPHAANSCYMAATLVPLAYVYDPLVQASLQRFENMEKTDSREQFCSLYSQLKSEATVEITIDQVHKLRVALQREFEYRFFTPNQSTQEDAGDFLMCILQDLLQEPPTGKFLQKRTFQSVDPDQEKEPDLYDYETALSTKYTKLDEVMKDITICEGLSFNELVTEVCPTNDIDLNAYRKHQNGEGPKFQSIMAHHQEQLLVESAESAPEFFCARLRRFSQDPITGVRKKDNTPIQPSRKLEFHIKDSDNTVAYDLCAVTVHSGKTLDGGHYYCYLLHDGKIYKYDDLTGADRVVNEASVWQDVVSNGYIFHYKKRT